MSRKYSQYLQLAVAAVVVLISALLSADPIRTPLGLWFGALWLLLAWRYGLSLVLMAVMVFLSLRSPVSIDLPAVWFLPLNIGLSAFALTATVQTRWSALLSAVLWVSMLAFSPLLLLVVLAGIPRFGKMHGEQVRFFVMSAVSFLLLIVGYQMLLTYGVLENPKYDGNLSPLMEKPFESETYEAIAAGFLTMFSVEGLWRFLPFVGIFEVIQKQPDDHKITWKNLLLIGALVSILVLPFSSFLQMLFLLGFPLTSILLTRWYLALPDIFSRTIYAVGMFGLLLPFLQGGLS